MASDTTRVTKRRKPPEDETTKILRKHDDTADDLPDEWDEMWAMWQWWEGQK